MSSDKGNFSSNEGMAQKIKKRTQEFLHAANAAAARSIQMSSSGHLSEMARSNDINDSKSLGYYEQSRNLKQGETKKSKDDRKDQLMKGTTKANFI